LQRPDLEGEIKKKGKQSRVSCATAQAASKSGWLAAGVFLSILFDEVHHLEFGTLKGGEECVQNKTGKSFLQTKREQSFRRARLGGSSNLSGEKVYAWPPDLVVTPHIHDIAGLEVLGVVDVRIECLGPRQEVGAGKTFSILIAQAKRSDDIVKDGADAF
jgi:hypothetical protein